MYTNLLLFLVAIFLFSVDRVPSSPLLPGWQALLLFVLLLIGYARLAGKSVWQGREPVGQPDIFRRKNSCRFSPWFFLARASISVMQNTTCLCSPLAIRMPALVNLAGLMLFVLFLAIMWRAGQKNYEMIFGRKQSTPAFILSNIKANLPIVLPWVILSLLYDIVALLPFPGLQKVIASEWGDLLLFGFFLFFVLIFFPPLVRRLWGCKKMPEGAV